MFAKYLELFLPFTYSESQWWNDMLMKWLELGAEDKKVAKDILITFHCKIAATSTLRAQDGSSKRICKVIYMGTLRNHLVIYMDILFKYFVFELKPTVYSERNCIPVNFTNKSVVMELTGNYICLFPVVK